MSPLLSTRCLPPLLIGSLNVNQKVLFRFEMDLFLILWSIYTTPRNKQKHWLCCHGRKVYWLWSFRNSNSKWDWTIHINYRDFKDRLATYILWYSLSKDCLEQVKNVISCCKSMRSSACLPCKMPMFLRVGMREGEGPLPLAFQYLICTTKGTFDLNLAVISSLASECQHFTVGMPVFQPFYLMKLKTSKFKVFAFWSQWKYHDQIEITKSSYHKNQILKC